MQPNSHIAQCSFSFINCKLASTLAGVNTGTTPRNVSAHLIGSDSANVTTREEHYVYGGNIIGDTGVYRVGGASDGVTNKSWKVTTLTTCNWLNRLYCPDIYQWVDSTGSKTITVYIARDNGAANLQTDDVGFELHYLGDASYPLGTFYTSLPDPLSAGSDWATDGTSAWTGITSETMQTMATTVTINQKGLIRVTPFVMKASMSGSTALYIDPLVVVT